MKKIFKIIFIFISFLALFWGNTYSENENEQLEMIERYIKTQKKNIKSISKKYNINDNILKEKENSLNNFLNIINKLKETEAQKEQKEEIIKYLTKSLKDLNLDIKDILKYHKEEFEKNLRKTQEAYNILWKKIWYSLDKIIILVEKEKLNKDIFNLKDSILKEKLNDLKNTSYILKNFWNLNFSSEDDMKNTFKKLIEKTKNQVLELKERLKD